MASPPFDINQAIPADNDIVSQHPGNARTMRDVVESWLLINHNVQGRHDEVQLDHKADPGSGTASVTEVWASNTANAAGKLKMRRGTGNVEYVGLPPGAIIEYAGSTEPEGWLFPDGRAVSRTTYADLFAAIGVAYGVGDGSTTFNLPDYRAREGLPRDNMGGTAANRVPSATVLGNGGGSETVVIAQANLPNVSFPVSIPSGQGSHDHDLSPDAAAPSGTTFAAGGTPGASTTGPARTAFATLPALTGTAASGGSGTAMATMPPYVVVNKLIKT